MAHRLPNSAAPLIALFLLLIFFSLVETPAGRLIGEFFLTADNLRFIAAQTVVVALGAMGMTLVLISAGMDLSAGAIASLGGVAAAVAMRMGHSPGEAILVAMGVGLVAGLINGTLIAFARLPSFMVTLGMMEIAHGMAQWVARGGPIPLSSNAEWLPALMAPFPEHRWFLVAPAVWLTLVLAGVAALFLRQTVLGRHMYAIGSNEAAARLCGVRVRFTKLCVYALAGLSFGLTGVVQIALVRQADPSRENGLGIGLELEIIAAAILGGASLRGGRGGVLGSVAGALTMVVLRNGAQQAGWPVNAQPIISGVVILAVVGIDRLRNGKCA